MRGRLIVLEGTDGSGKATQTGLLCDRLSAEGRPVRRLTFPRYEEDSSMLVRMYLSGSFGSRPGDVNAYAASAFYAVDRYASYRQDWQGDYEGGKLILADRYTTSNAVHQASKLPGGERREFLAWLFDLEYRRLGLPEPDLVIYLDMPTEAAERLMRRREAETRTQADIHERDGEYLRRCRESAGEIAAMQGWAIVSCAAGNVPRTPEDIHREVASIVNECLSR